MAARQPADEDGRRVGQRRHREAHRRRQRLAGAVAERVGEALVTAPVSRRRVDQASLRVAAQRPVRRLAGEGQRQRIAIGIEAQRRQVERELAVLVQFGDMVARQRRVIDGGDRQADEAVDRGCAVADADREGIVAMVVGCRAVGVAAVVRRRQAAVPRRAGGERERIAVGIARHGQQVENDHAVLGQAGGERAQPRQVVDRRHRQPHLGLRRHARCAAQPVAEAIVAVPVGRRLVEKAAVGIRHDGAVRRRADDFDSAGAGNAGVVGEYVDAQRGVLGRRGGVILRAWRLRSGSEMQVADRHAAVARLRAIAGSRGEADQVEGEVEHGAGGDAAQVDEVADATVGVGRDADLARQCFAAVGLAVERGVAARQAAGAQQGQPGIGVDQRQLERVVGTAQLIADREVRQREGQEVVVAAEHEDLVETSLVFGRFEQGGGAIAEVDVAGRAPAATIAEGRVLQAGVGGDVELRAVRCGFSSGGPILAGAISEAGHAGEGEGNARGKGRIGVAWAVGRRQVAGELQQGELVGDGECPSNPRAQRRRHEMVWIRAVLEPERVPLLVQENGQQVDPAVGGRPGPRHPLAGVAGRQELLVEQRRCVDEPAVAGGIGVESDLGGRTGAGRVAEGEIGEVGEGGERSSPGGPVGLSLVGRLLRADR
ncbi:MAG: hypothetical protein AW07_04164 [Candidatus Accumulibacter sp. SK-11]|nr:MAG: hypothetical protein AW07_04164 [Candidatus Accumulibacter sp. SK-11]